MESPSVQPSYVTSLGRMYGTTAEEFLDSPACRDLRGAVQLLFTSPPFPLTKKKKYGNRQGEEYIEWLASFAARFKRLLRRDGSIVLEVGNSWEPGAPTMSTLPIRALIAFSEAGGYEICQQFIAYNPARLPSPAQWVNVERIRLKDAHTHLWWMSGTDRPKADNRRVLGPYSVKMRRLLEAGRYNSGLRPSEHLIGGDSFLRDNGGAIPASVLTVSNTRSSDRYLNYCKEQGITPHPARMPTQLAEFFIRFLTDEGDLVFDPFAGSNTTGAVAEGLRRRWVATEPSPEYVRGSKGRFDSLSERVGSLGL